MNKSNLKEILEFGLEIQCDDTNIDLSETQPKIDPKETYKTLQQILPDISNRLGYEVRKDDLYNICNSKTYNPDYSFAIKDKRKNIWLVPDSKVGDFIDVVETYFHENPIRFTAENTSARGHPARYLFANTLVLLAAKYKENETIASLVDENRKVYSIDELIQIFNVPEETVNRLIDLSFFPPIKKNNNENTHLVSGKYIAQLYSAVKDINSHIENPENVLLKETITKIFNKKDTAVIDNEELEKFISAIKLTKIIPLYEKIHGSEFVDNSE